MMKTCSKSLLIILLFFGTPLQAAVRKPQVQKPTLNNNAKKERERWKYHRKHTKGPIQYRFSPPIFDFPVTYNQQVRKWIRYFQTKGRRSFRRWMERSARFSPYIKKELEKHELPQDLLYVAMIESGFSPRAHSPAGAMGIWQFVAPTARRYGLKVNWWLDERKNFTKATEAAIRYKKDLHKMFGSWHLVSASYNTGENRIKRLIRKHRTNNFWDLANKRVISDETVNYVPKIIAATLIAKSPALYGFRNLNYHVPFKFETMEVPGGTNLKQLAQHIGVKAKYLRQLNPDLVKGYIPRDIKSHQIKVPMGSRKMVNDYAKLVQKYRKL